MRIVELQQLRYAVIQYELQQGSDAKVLLVFYFKPMLHSETIKVF